MVWLTFNDEQLKALLKIKAEHEKGLAFQFGHRRAA